MNEAETKELIEKEVRKYVGPRTLNTLMVLLLVALICIFYLWAETSTNRSWITSLRGDMKGLENAHQLAEEIEESRLILLSIADKVGADNPPTEDSNDGIRSVQSSSEH